MITIKVTTIVVIKVTTIMVIKVITINLKHSIYLQTQYCNVYCNSCNISGALNFANSA